MNVKRIYIAGRITGLAHEEVKKNFDKAKQTVELLGHKPVSPLDLTHNHSRTWESYMKEDLTVMMQCDGVFVQSNWRQSKGASIELDLAKKLNMNVIFQEQ